MAMQLEFYVPDGPNGESMSDCVRVKAWEIPFYIDAIRSKHHCYIMLTHTSRQRGQWIVWVRPGYDSGTRPALGQVRNLPES